MSSPEESVEDQNTNCKLGGVKESNTTSNEICESNNNFQSSSDEETEKQTRTGIVEKINGVSPTHPEDTIEKENKYEIENKNLHERLTEITNTHERMKIDYNKLRQAYLDSQQQIKTQDEKSKEVLNNVKNEYNQAIKVLKEKCATMDKEKGISVMNYARREKELLDANHKLNVLDKKFQTTFIERDKLSVEVKTLTAEIVKLKSVISQKNKDAKLLHTKMEVVKEDASSHNIKIKWAQNKLKTEVDAHNETKEKLAKALGSIKQANEETEQIRKNCQEMIKTYQESEEIKSNSLDMKLKETEEVLANEKQMVQSLEDRLKSRDEELAQNYKELIAAKKELDVLKQSEDELNATNEDLVERNERYEATLNDQKTKIAEMGVKLQTLLELEVELENAQSEIERLNTATEEGKELVKQSNDDKDIWKAKEQELLDFTMKLTTKNAELGSHCENLQSRIEIAEKTLQEKYDILSSIEKENIQLKSTVAELEAKLLNTSETFDKSLEERDKSICNLTVKLEEKSDEIRTIKRKNAARLKDLTRQLQQYKKDLKNDNSDNSQNGDSTLENGIGSRTGSCTSLEIIEPNHISVDGSSSVSSSNSADHSSIPDTMISKPPPLNHSLLVDRIIRLQHVHAKKNEKIDFLQDHITRLTEKLKKQSRLVQHYMIREESGMLSSPVENFEKNARGKMTLEFSLEINQKMQSVLEDTILKNIALKESIDALGGEVARLTRTHNSKDGR